MKLFLIGMDRRRRRLAFFGYQLLAGTNLMQVYDAWRRGAGMLLYISGTPTAASQIMIYSDDYKNIGIWVIYATDCYIY